MDLFNGRKSIRKFQFSLINIGLPVFPDGLEISVIALRETSVDNTCYAMRTSGSGARPKENGTVTGPRPQTKGTVPSNTGPQVGGKHQPLPRRGGR